MDEESNQICHIFAVVIVINTTIKTTSVCDGDARSVGGGRGWLAGDTNGLAGWPVTGDGGRAWSASHQQTLSGTGARVYTAYRGWLGVLKGISATSTGGVLVKYNTRR